MRSSSGDVVSVPVMGLHFMRSPRYTAKSYVRDGLVAMWDGIENAGWGTHDASATVWKDLAGNNNLDIYGSVQDNCVRTTNTAAAEKSGLTIPGIATIEACYNLTSTSNPQGLVFYSGNIDSTRLGLVVYGKSVGFQTYTNKFWNYPTVLTPQKYSVSVTDSTCVVNGTVLSEVAHSTDTWNNGNYTGIGGIAWQNTWKSYGDYYCVRIYDRELTAAEVAHNCAVDKGRFNLP